MKLSDQERFMKNEKEKMRLKMIKFGFDCLKFSLENDAYIRHLTKPDLLIYVVNFIDQLENIIYRIEKENELLKFLLYIIMK